MKSTDWIDSITPIPADRPALAVRVFDRLLGWLERSRQRRTLGQLDERMLSDIGCDRASAAAEANKPFWQR